MPTTPASAPPATVDPETHDYIADLNRTGEARAAASRALEAAGRANDKFRVRAKMLAHYREVVMPAEKAFVAASEAAAAASGAFNTALARFGWRELEARHTAASPAAEPRDPPVETMLSGTGL